MSDKQPEPEKLEPKDNLSVTQHSLTTGGETLSYTATTGTLVLREEVEDEGAFMGHKPKASVFITAYTKDGVDDLAKRPITFSFNGGPGSSSVWLHLGVFGPRKVQMNEDDTSPTKPPFGLTDNAFTLLKHSDLVFIDPVSTGFSRPAEGEKAEQFHTLKRDVETVAEVIRLYTSRNGRWASPKFLAGESYGTTRAALLSSHLQRERGMYLNGLVLVSSILNFQTVLSAPGNDLPFALFLPSFTAAAHYHGCLPKRLQDKPLGDVLKEAGAFALGEYATLLLKGSSLSGSEEKRLTRKLADFTGLSQDYVRQTNHRVNIHRFVKALLREQRKTVGRLDARVTGRDLDAAGEQAEADPSLDLITGPYGGAFNHYVRAELRFENDLPYEILKSIYKTWRFEKDNQYTDVAEELRKAFQANPHLRVYVANGLYDLATPFLATEYTFDHLGLPAELRGNIELAYFEAGHMMYTHPASLEKLSADVGRFVRNSS